MSDPVRSATGTRRLQRWNRRHWAVLLYVLEHPAARRAEIARATGYIVDHLSRILGSQEFRQRHKAVFDRVLVDVVRKLLRCGD